MCLCLWMIAHMFGADGSAMLSARASLVRLIVRLIVRRSSVTDLSVRPYLLVHRLCIARLPVPLPLVCLLIADPSLVCR